MPARLADALMRTLRLRKVATVRELGQELGLSQPSVSRLVASVGSQVARIGRARSSRYAATREVRGLGERWPLYRIDGAGKPQALGELLALYGDYCQLRATPLPAWLRGEFAEGLFPGLPWFIDDMRPQGFMGRAFAQRYAAKLGLRPDILIWNQDEVLATLLLRGDDGPGNFVLGDIALEQALRGAPAPIPAAQRAERYALLAATALVGAAAGSSAAGEQPKFTACVEDPDGSLRQVIVKFSEPAQAHPVARRWADLLVCESLAGELLREHDLPSAATERIWSQGRLCLESTRFDRIGAHGRRGLVSLAAWSDAYDGERDNWPATATRMHGDGWLSAEDLARVERLWWFGRMIGNTDMHFGNLGFFLDEGLPLVLAPSYDMLPMAYRPAGNGSLPVHTYQPPPPLPAAMPAWRQATAMAAALWQRAAEHAEIGEDFRRIAAANGAVLEAWRQRFA